MTAVNKYMRIAGITLAVISCNCLFSQKVAVTGDYIGGTEQTRKVSLLIRAHNPDLIITVGDNHSAFYGGMDLQVGQFYSDYIAPFSGAAGNATAGENSFFPALGNHDYDLNDTGSYFSFFELPGNERYYDFVRGDIHFFALNSFYTEVNGVTDTSLQAAWLKNGLLNSTSCYNIVYFHHSPYSSGPHGCNTYMQWPFAQWGATAVLSGHDHCYERVDTTGIPFIVCGTGGQALYTYYNPLAGSTVHYAGNHGALFLDANADSILFQFVNVKDSVVDCFSINHCALATGQEEPVVPFQVKAFPNPFRTEISFEVLLGKKEEVRLEIFEMNGQRIYFKNMGLLPEGKHVGKWSRPVMPPGTYLFRIQAGNQAATGKIIKTM